MPFVLPTLQSIVFQRIALELWRQPAIVSIIKDLYEHDNANFEAWSVVEQKVVGNISCLSMPNLLTDETNDAIVRMGHRIRIWLNKILDFMPRNYIVDYIHSICVNSDGGIDSQNTTKLIVQIQSLDIKDRYFLACNNFLEDNVQNLWEELSADQKECILQNGNFDPIFDNTFVAFWSHCKLEKLDSLDGILRQNKRWLHDINHYFIKYSITNSNEVAFKYFWQKLSKEEQSKHIVKYAIESVKNNLRHWFIQHPCYVDELFVDLADGRKQICYYLKCQMNETHLKQMAQQEFYAVMHLWIWCAYSQDSFVSWNCLFNSISPTAFYNSLEGTFTFFLWCKTRSEFFQRRSKAIFKELWRYTPNSFKQEFFRNVYTKKSAINSMILDVDDEILKLFFDDASAEEKKHIVNSAIGKVLIRKPLLMTCLNFQPTSHFKDEAHNEFIE